MEHEELREFIHMMSDISGKLHHIRNMEIPLGMNINVNTAMLSALDYISRCSNLNMSEISIKMTLTKGAVSQMAQKLLQRGLIEKSKSSDNTKDIYLVVTEKGKQALEEYHVHHDKLYYGISEILSDYDKKEIKMIYDFLIQTDQFLGNFKKNMEAFGIEDKVDLKATNCIEKGEIADD